MLVDGFIPGCFSIFGSPLNSGGRGGSQMGIFALCWKKTSGSAIDKNRNDLERSRRRQQQDMPAERDVSFKGC